MSKREITLVASSQLESHGTVSTVGAGDDRGDRIEIEEKKGGHVLVEIALDVASTGPRPQNSSALSDLPEGGLHAWLTILGAFLVQYASFGYINAFGVYQDFYVRDYLNNYTPSDIGWIGGVQISLNFCLGVFTGGIFDRGHLSLMIGSILLHAIALFTLSLSHTGSYYQVFLTNGVALGLSSGLSYLPSLSIAGHYFKRRRALAVGIVSSGSALGTVLHPIMLNRLFNSPRVGFHTGIRISAGLNILLLIIAYAMMKPNPRLSLEGHSKSSTDEDETQPRDWTDRFPVLRWLREPAYAISVFASVFLFSGTFFPVFYLQLDAIIHGIDPTFAFYAVSILNAASIAGRTIPGALAPHVGLFNLGSVMMLAMGVVLFCMAPAVSTGAGTAPVVAFALLFGFFSGAAIALTPAMFAQLAEDASEVGARLGVVFGIGAAPIAGALLTKHYYWIRPIAFCGSCIIIAGLLFLVSRYFLAKKLNTWKV